MKLGKTKDRSTHWNKYLSWRGLTLQLFSFVVLPLIVLVLTVTFGSLELHHQAMRSLIADRNLRAVESAAFSISQELSQYEALLQLLSRMDDPAEPTDTTLNKFKENLEVFDGGVAIFSLDGSLLSSTGKETIPALTESEQWMALFDSMKTVPSGQVVYLPAQSIHKQLYVPLVIANSSRVYIGLFSPEILISQHLAILQQQGSVGVIVVDQEYRTLYQYGKLYPLENVSSHPGMQSALSGTSKIDYYDTTDGELVVTHSPIERIGWALMIEEPWEDITSPLLRYTQYSPLIIIPILIVSVLAVWFGLRRIVQPLRALEMKTADLARGNFITVQQPVGGVPEIQNLQATLIYMAAQVQEAQDSLHQYIGAITQGVESERKRLARELHDETMQSLIALGQYTQYALHWNTDEKVNKTLEQMLEVTDGSTRDLRRLIQGLRPIYIEDLGLSTAVAMLAAENNIKANVQITFQQAGNERRFAPEAEMALYRIAQESLNNVIQHAQAQNTWLLLNFEPDTIVLEIRDDGIGFVPPEDPSQYARLGHFGILGLHERCELMGASLVIDSRPGQGTLITVTLANSTTERETTETGANNA